MTLIIHTCALSYWVLTTVSFNVFNLAIGPTFYWHLFIHAIIYCHNSCTNYASCTSFKDFLKDLKAWTKQSCKLVILLCIHFNVMFSSGRRNRLQNLTGNQTTEDATQTPILLEETQNQTQCSLLEEAQESNSWRANYLRRCVFNSQPTAI